MMKTLAWLDLALVLVTIMEYVHNKILIYLMAKHFDVRFNPFVKLVGLIESCVKGNVGGI